LRKLYLAVVVVCFAFIGTAQATIHIVSLGTNAPPPTVGGFSMSAFAADPVADGTFVSTAPGPGGRNLSFSPALDKLTVPGSWNNWSNGYASTVYADTSGTTATVTLPGLTRAFYLYSEGNDFATINITVTSNSGASLTQTVTTPDGAEGFGIFTDGDDTIATVTIDAPAAAAGFAIGEFGIFTGAGISVAAVPTLSQSTLLLLALLLLGCGVYVQRKRHSR
jgi:hypothetical protein